MIIGLITARAGSRRLPGKNLLKLGGVTLIERTVREAYASSIFDAVIFSTDIPKAGIAAGEDHFDMIYDRRPKKLCGSRTSTDEVIAYIIGKYGLESDDEIILLQPTSPFRTKKHIVNAHKLLVKHSLPVYAVKQAKGDASWYFEERGGKAVPAFKSAHGAKVFMLNGAVYAFKVRHFQRESKLPYDSFIPLIMKEKESLDIDTNDDYLTAKMMLHSKKAKQEDK